VTTDLRAELTAAFADVSLADPVEQVVRRGRRIRRARRARRVAPALVAAAAVVVGVTVSGGADRPATLGPVELVGQQSQTFPLSFDAVPAGLTGPSLSLDPSFEDVGPGRAHAGWHDPGDPASGVGLQVDVAEPSTDGDDEIAEARIGEADGTVFRTDVTGADPVVSVVWERAEDQWVTVSGEGRFASESAVVQLARQVVDRAIAVPLQLTLAPRGWVLVAYKEDRVVTLADPTGDPAADATARTLTVQLPQPPSDPADLSREVGATGDLVEVTVHGRPGYVLPTADGWFLQASLPDGTVFVVQAPADLSLGQVVEVAEGVRRP
jgi:hypothetical protein